MNSDLFDIKRHKNKKDDSNIEYSIILNIWNYNWLRDNQTNREIRTKRPDFHEDSNSEEHMFHIKIKFVGHKNDLLEIYYLSQKNAFVKPSCSLYKLFRLNYEKMYDCISNKPYQLVLKNQWQLLGVQFKENLHAILGDDYKKTMELTFNFSVYQSTEKFPTELSYIPIDRNRELNDFNCTLTDDLTSLMSNVTLSDVTIKSTEGDEFPAHKIILFSRSEVFKAHFEHDTVERKTNIVESPFKTDVLKEVITYIYTDNAPKIDELSEKLLKAADFYQLNGLIRLCEDALEKKLSIENAMDMLKLANLHRAIDLERKTLEFIKDGLAGAITETEGWKKAESIDMIKSIYEYVVKY